MRHCVNYLLSSYPGDGFSGLASGDGEFTDGIDQSIMVLLEDELGNQVFIKQFNHLGDGKFSGLEKEGKTVKYWKACAEKIVVFY